MKNKETAKVHDVAILMMAGKGERLFDSLHVKKQFYRLGDQELFLYSLKTLYFSGCFRKIVLVISEEDRAHVQEVLKASGVFDLRRISLVSGGNTRNESVGKALFSLKKSKGRFYVLIHDAARPFLTKEQVTNIMSKTYRAEALTYCLPLADSLFREDRSGIVYLDRKNLFQVQTPQVFDYQKILAIYEEGYDPNGTDDFSKAVHAGLRTLPLVGDLSLFKVTGKEDLRLLEKLVIH